MRRSQKIQPQSQKYTDFNTGSSHFYWKLWASRFVQQIEDLDSTSKTESRSFAILATWDCPGNVRITNHTTAIQVMWNWTRILQLRRWTVPEIMSYIRISSLWYIVLTLGYVQKASRKENGVRKWKKWRLIICRDIKILYALAHCLLSPECCRIHF